MDADIAPGQTETEAAAVLDDIRIAGEQIARGEGINHDAAERLALQALRQRTADVATDVVSAKADGVQS